MNPNKNAFAKPGRISGKDTVQNVCHRDALRVWDASSFEGLIPSTTPINTRNAIGVYAKICAIRIPVSPYNHRVGGIPNAHSKNALTAPALPNKSIRASPITKGGVIIGSKEAVRIKPFA